MIVFRIALRLLLFAHEVVQICVSVIRLVTLCVLPDKTVNVLRNIVGIPCDGKEQVKVLSKSSFQAHAEG